MLFVEAKLGPSTFIPLRRWYTNIPIRLIDMRDMIEKFRTGGEISRL